MTGSECHGLEPVAHKAHEKMTKFKIAVMAAAIGLICSIGDKKLYMVNFTSGTAPRSALMHPALSTVVSWC